MSIIVTLEDWSRARSGKKKSNIGCCSPLLFTVRICRNIHGWCCKQCKLVEATDLFKIQKHTRSAFETV